MNSEYTNRILRVINNAVYTCEGRYLSDIEEKVLLGSLKEQKYEEIANKHKYCTRYISQNIGFNLWKMLTKVLGESVSKKNIQSVSRRAVENDGFNTVSNNYN